MQRHESISTTSPRRRSRIFVSAEDKDFLWQWSARLRETEGVLISPDHFLSIIIGELRAGQAQGRLLNVHSEIEARAIALARREDEYYREQSRIHAQERQVEIREQDRREAERLEKMRAYQRTAAYRSMVARRKRILRRKVRRAA